MNILWHGVPAAWKTGYGIQTDLFTRKLKAEGHNVMISAIVGGMPHFSDHNGILTLSPGLRANSLGNDLIRKHVQYSDADIVLSCFDTFCADCRKMAEIPWVPWQVIDSSPLMYRLKEPCETAGHNLAMSRFGESVMRSAGITNVTYVPLACNMDEYYPIDRNAARQEFCKMNDITGDISENFILMMNAANMSTPSRKNFAAAFKAFAQVLKVIPNALFYVHTEETGIIARGEDLRKTAEMYGLNPQNLIFPHQYEYSVGMFGYEQMRALYNAADCLIAPSLGEGFCLPVVEAYACGIPVIGSGWSSLVELIEVDWQVKQGIVSQSTYISGTEQFFIDHKALAAKIIDMWETLSGSGSLARIGRQAELRALVKDKYGIDQVFADYMKPLLNKIETGEINIKPKKKENANAVPK